MNWIYDIFGISKYFSNAITLSLDCLIWYSESKKVKENNLFSKVWLSLEKSRISCMGSIFHSQFATKITKITKSIETITEISHRNLFAFITSITSNTCKSLLILNSFNTSTYIKPKEVSLMVKSNHLIFYNSGSMIWILQICCYPFIHMANGNFSLFPLWLSADLTDFYYMCSVHSRSNWYKWKKGICLLYISFLLFTEILKFNMTIWCSVRS